MSNPELAPAAWGTSILAKIARRTIKGDGCWEWNGSHDRKGYIKLHTPTKNGARETLYVHRVVLSLKLGRHLAADECACHTCDNPGCVNPDHLFLGTRADNNEDRDRKGRNAQPKGEAHGNAKLTAEKVHIIRTSKEVGVVLAKQLGVSPQLISRVKHGHLWKHTVTAAPAIEPGD